MADSNGETCRSPLSEQQQMYLLKRIKINIKLILYSLIKKVQNNKNLTIVIKQSLWKYSK